MGQGPQNPCVLSLQSRTNGLIEPAPSMALVPVHRPTPVADGEAAVDAVEEDPRRRATQIQCIEVAFQKFL